MLLFSEFQVFQTLLSFVHHVLNNGSIFIKCAIQNKSGCSVCTVKNWKLFAKNGHRGHFWFDSKFAYAGKALLTLFSTNQFRSNLNRPFSHSENRLNRATNRYILQMFRMWTTVTESLTQLNWTYCTKIFKISFDPASSRPGHSKLRNEKRGLEVHL